jgi:hypothetical protein
MNSLNDTPIPEFKTDILSHVIDESQMSSSSYSSGYADGYADGENAAYEYMMKFIKKLLIQRNENFS